MGNSSLIPQFALRHDTITDDPLTIIDDPQTVKRLWKKRLRHIPADPDLTNKVIDLMKKHNLGPKCEWQRWSLRADGVLGVSSNVEASIPCDFVFIFTV